MKKAFSLIELSIVILIIGILVAGVTQGSRLVAAFRLQTARNLTQSSPVASINDLTLWYETSMENSFIAREAEEAGLLSIWYDINPQSTDKHNATQATAASQPKFYTNVFNNALPGVRFDGTADFMTFDGNSLVGTGYTIFLVGQRRGGDNGAIGGHFISGTDLSGSDKFIYLGHRLETVATFGYPFTEVGIPSYTKPIPTIYTASLSTTTGKKLWLNGGVTPDATNATTTTLTSWVGSALGRNSSSPVYYLNGDIAEVIMFTRTLKNEERQTIEAYLAKKYNITIS